MSAGGAEEFETDSSKRNSVFGCEAKEREGAEVVPAGEIRLALRPLLYNRVALRGAPKYFPNTRHFPAMNPTILAVWSNLY